MQDDDEEEKSGLPLTVADKNNNRSSYATFCQVAKSFFCEIYQVKNINE